MMMTLRLLLAFSVLSSLLLTSSAQTCNTQKFSNNKVFASCRDLPQLTSYLHWTYNQTTGKLDIAFVHGEITSTNKWVAWGINSNNDLRRAMIGAQTLVAIPQSNGSPKVYTSSVDSTDTQLQESSISYPVSGLSSTFQNNEVTIFASLTLPKGTTSVVHVWEDGPLSGSTPQEHSQGSGHQSSKQTLQLISGQTLQEAEGEGSSIKKRNTHGVLNAVSWGVLMPLGAVIARYLKVFKSTGAAWFYLHVTCQASAYIVGVAGLGTGLSLGDESVASDIDTHKTLGIILVALGTLQVFALFLRPNPNHKYRLYWNVYHHVVGYTTIIISIVNIFKGFDALGSYGDYSNWKHAYTGIIIVLAGIAVVLEVITWIIVVKRRRSERKMAYGNNGVNGYGNGNGNGNGNGINGANGVNGYGSRPHQQV